MFEPLELESGRRVLRHEAGESGRQNDARQNDKRFFHDVPKPFDPSPLIGRAATREAHFSLRIIALAYSSLRSLHISARVPSKWLMLLDVGSTGLTTYWHDMWKLHRSNCIKPPWTLTATSKWTRTATKSTRSSGIERLLPLCFRNSGRFSATAYTDSAPNHPLVGRSLHMIAMVLPKRLILLHVGPKDLRHTGTICGKDMVRARTA